MMQSNDDGVISIKTILAGVIMLIFTLAASAWADLSGKWSCDDGGTYYLRQTGRQLYWYAESNASSPAWATVFSGRIYGARIKGRWADVPKGQAAGAGDMELVVSNGGNTLQAVKNRSGYRGSRWNRQDPHAPSRRSLEQLQPPAKDACHPFDPSDIRVQQMDGRWQLIHKRHWLFDFGPDQAAAHKALEVIRHYRMDRICFLGASQQSSFSYLLAKGGIPWGAMDGEDCMAIDPAHLAVSKRQGRWKIVSDKKSLFDFGNRQSEARQALAIIRQHGFTKKCRVGAARANFTYLRR